MKDYTLTFSEMTQMIFDKKGYGVGEHFKPGVFLDLLGSCIIIKQKQKNGLAYTTIGNPPLSKGLLNQKYKVIVCVDDKELGLA